MNDVLVSILCLAYNHELYIEKTIEGILRQKTNFKFEVLINEDCSNDNTKNIIKKYECLYPDIIKPVYQVENQYSKGVSIIKDILVPKAKGKYVAFCECDDYWTDSKKLQKQIDFLEKNSHCTFCFTNAEVVDLDTNEKYDFINFLNKGKKIGNRELFDLGEFLECFSFIPTASFVFPKKNYELFPKSFNDYCFGGDRKISLYSTALGLAGYIPEKTCVYRRNVPTSAMTKSKKIKGSIIQKRSLDFLNLYNNIDFMTENKFSAELKMCKDRCIMDYILSLNSKLDFFRKENLKYYSQMANNYKIKTIIKLFFSRTNFLYVKIKHFLKG